MRLQVTIGATTGANFSEYFAQSFAFIRLPALYKSYSRLRFANGKSTISHDHFLYFWYQVFAATLDNPICLTNSPTIAFRVNLSSFVSPSQ